jgi:hypothetical protein
LKEITLLKPGELKLARTIADLDGAEEVGSLHLAEALTYRIDTTRQLRAARTRSRDCTALGAESRSPYRDCSRRPTALEVKSTMGTIRA